MEQAQIVQIQGTGWLLQAAHTKPSLSGDMVILRKAVPRSSPGFISAENKNLLVKLCLPAPSRKLCQKPYLEIGSL